VPPPTSPGRITGFELQTLGPPSYEQAIAEGAGRDIERLGGSSRDRMSLCEKVAVGIFLTMMCAAVVTPFALAIASAGGGRHGRGGHH
jgi:hypothetical protein